MSRFDNSDKAIARVLGELDERKSAIKAIIGNAQDAERDLNKSEQETLENLRHRVGELNTQLTVLQESTEVVDKAIARAQEIGDAMVNTRRNNGDAEVQYRSAGAWLLDSYMASIGDRPAAQRLELFHRVAAHQKTADNLGIIPDPVIGNVINFIDAARPLVSFVGPQNMPSATWHRPRVTQSTSVAVQGSAGGASDEKAELASQKMTITRLNATAVTYGGYVNVSRQNIDFSSPQALDIVINDLSAQYAIQTEAALAAELAATTTPAIGYGATPSAASVAAALWEAVGTIYAAMKGQGRLALAVAPDVLGLFGPLFAPVNPQTAQSPGLTAGQFGQGVMGTISGIPVIMSAGLSAGEAFVFSTAAIEAFEQRVGTLQATEPSVLGVQVAYAGYFTALTIEDDGIVPLATADGS